MLALLLVLLSPTLHAAGVELQVQYSAIQKALSQQIFPGDGRLYVQGAPETKCSFAFLEHPVVAGLDGHIEIRARFSGRNAASVFGLCLGLGDTFELRILAVPLFQNGMIRLQSVEVETMKDSYYTRRVRESVQDSLTKKFEYNVTEEARRILERRLPGEAFQQQMRNFQVSQIRATAEALILQLEFTLIVK